MSTGGSVDDQPSYVLDASAILAFLHREPGSELVEAAVPVSVISSVNWAEVLQKIIARGGREPQEVVEELEYLGLEVIPFTPEDAMGSALLWSSGRKRGLSLADRACLSVAQRLELSALTGDRRWADLGLGIKVQLIR